MECYSCYAISEMNFVIVGKIDIPNKKAISMCCEKYPPSTFLSDNPRENLERFIGMRHLEIIRGLSDDAKQQDTTCARCWQYVKKDWNFSTHILYVNLSIYPSPCQCHCFYCNASSIVNNSFECFKKNSDIYNLYENAFNTLKLAKETGLIINQGTQWQISCGEITVHPYRKEIFDLTRGEKARFYTNAFIFDKDIARELHDNPAASINLSIDAGTAETWRKVKRVDNFNHVLDNLIAYRKSSTRAGQITLKYIICPGVNDSEEDFRAFVDIVKLLDVQDVRISINFVAKREPPIVNGFFSDSIESAARLLAICNFNGINVKYLWGYNYEEQECINLLAQKLLEHM